MNSISSRIFVPICLYDKSIFSKKKSIRMFLSKYVKDAEVLFLICDKLYLINKMIDRTFNNEEEALIKAKNRGINVHSLLKNQIQVFDDTSKIIISFWDELCVNDKFKIIYAFVEKLFSEDEQFNSIVNGFINNYLRFQTKSLLLFNKDKVEYEKKYLFNEIAMSLYVTEILHYNTELWEKINPNIQPDPLEILYKDYSIKLKSILKVSQLNRQLNYITISV